MRYFERRHYHKTFIYLKKNLSQEGSFKVDKKRPRVRRRIATEENHEIGALEYVQFQPKTSIHSVALDPDISKSLVSHFYYNI